MSDGKLIVLSEEQLNELISKSAEVGAKAAMEKVDLERKNNGKRMKDRRIHNTEILLRNYNMFKMSVENSVYTVRQMESEASANEILSLMMGNSNDELTIRAIKESKAKTAIIVDHIDTMLELFKIYCERSTDPLDERRYKILIDRYISDPALSVKEISKTYNVSKESVYKDLCITKERVSALIFGVDGVNLR